MHLRLVWTLTLSTICLVFISARADAASESEAACPVGDTSCMTISDEYSTSGGGGPAFFQSYPKPYCDPKSGNPTKVSYSLTYYLTNSGDQTIVSPEGEIDPSRSPIEVGHANSNLEPGDIHLYERWHTHCAGVDAEGNKTWDKAIEFWMPLVTVDSLAYQFDVVDRVVEQLGPPEVEFVDADIDHGWLYVNVDHHVRVERPESKFAYGSARNPTGWAMVWVEGVPIDVELELPGETGVEGLADCDFDLDSGSLCDIKFSHSSSISDDGWFHGKATAYWRIRSNSGKYNGLGPFTTQSEFETQVAEAMAVTRN